MSKYSFPAAPVVYNDAAHSYFCDGKQLKSVTQIIRERLFPDKYGDVSEEVLEKAARFGKAIHSAIEICINENSSSAKKYLSNTFFGEYDDNGVEILEVANCVFDKAVSFLLLNGIGTLKSEYLVTDCENVAGSIDLVAEIQGKLAIVDYKFTYNFDKEYLSWQESIYAWLFEKMTGRRIDELYAIWVPKRNAELGRYEKIDRKTDEEIENLIFVNMPVAKTPENVPAEINDMLQSISDILIAEKVITDKKKEMAERLLALMEQHNVTSWKNDYFTASYVAPTTRKTFDKAKLLKEHPEINEADYEKVSNVKSSVKFTTK